MPNGCLKPLKRPNDICRARLVQVRLNSILQGYQSVYLKERGMCAEEKPAYESYLTEYAVSKTLSMLNLRIAKLTTSALADMAVTKMKTAWNPWV